MKTFYKYFLTFIWVGIPSKNSERKNANSYPATTMKTELNFKLIFENERYIFDVLRRTFVARCIRIKGALCRGDNCEVPRKDALLERKRKKKDSKLLKNLKLKLGRNCIKIFKVSEIFKSTLNYFLSFIRNYRDAVLKRESFALENSTAHT
ncbi:hypothetical protein PUN28_017492 [Cardiocondyla obscurior]|uniref:Uncharacterized protein n=1 Tax=Cardiocondyla obscurior TaxID=286306 RepID=A0AAW2EJ13_9HYME